MTGALISFAVLALLAVAAGEVSELPWRRRLADAGRSRLPAAAQRLELRR
ncbi:hypothetical protein [Bradyrhizobium japonicum]|nr:hypothetical protein [Bradyrhizobium japonicum]